MSDSLDNVEFEPRWDDPVMRDGLRCPRCGGTSLMGNRYTLNKTHGGVQTDEYFARIVVIEHYCRNCGLWEKASDDSEAFNDLERRWSDPRYQPPTKQELDARFAATLALRDKHEREQVWPIEPPVVVSTAQRDAKYQDSVAAEKRYPENLELREAVIADPDNDDPRRAYAAWMREQPAIFYKDPFLKNAPSVGTDPKSIARFIDTQLAVANAYRADPTSDPVHLLEDFEIKDLSYLRGGLEHGEYGREDINHMGLLSDNQGFYRGFTGHATMQTKYFLAFSGELFRRAPIQHLELTYATPQIEQLAATRDLWRVRSLRLPERNDWNKHMRLNGLTDHAIRVLASSPHLAGLTYLDLEDAALSVTAFDYLALSPHLTSLSHVSLDVYAHQDHFQQFGIRTEKGSCSSYVAMWTEELEARHGYLPFLHPEEHYGTRTPDEERVTAHPVGKRSFRPDIAERTRPRLPIEIVDAICTRIDPETATVRDRAVAVPMPTGRFVATIDRVAPGIEGVALLVTLTVQQAPANIAVFDHAMQRTTTLTPRATLTLLVPTFLVALPS